MRRNLLLLGAGCGATVGIGWVLRDYRRWRALGPGGLPTNWAGWWRMTRWRLEQRDPLALTRPRPGEPSSTVALLADLPARGGARPRVAPHPVPHRQLDAHAPAPLIDELQRLFEDRAAAEPGRLSMATSHFEKRHAAVTLVPGCRGCADARASNGEVGHVHPSDGSMHVVLSRADTQTVIAQGWGERHGLAGLRLGLPATYMMIYAPRSAHDLPIVSSILEAAIAHMAGDRLDAAN